MGRSAVSYTHLDVYKRQAVASILESDEVSRQLDAYLQLFIDDLVQGESSSEELNETLRTTIREQIDQMQLPSQDRLTKDCLLYTAGSRPGSLSGRHRPDHSRRSPSRRAFGRWSGAGLPSVRLVTQMCIRDSSYGDGLLSIQGIWSERLSCRMDHCG